MGFYSTIDISHDGLGDIKRYAKQFSENLCDAISRYDRRGRNDIAAGGFANVGTVLVQDHRDSHHMLVTGYNEDLGYCGSWSTDLRDATPEKFEEYKKSWLRQIARSMGYEISFRKAKPR